MDGGTGTDWLQLTAPGLGIDIASLVGRVGNIEGLHLSNGSDDLALELDAFSVAGITDAGHGLRVVLDNGDTLHIGGSWLETGRNTDGDGHETVDYALFTGADTSVLPASLLHVQWLAAGSPG